QSFAQRAIVAAPGAVANAGPIGADQLARPPLAHPMRRFQMSDGLAPQGGRHHFFPSRSFSAALSIIASANSFFSLAFSLSKLLSFWASDTSMPPNLAFQA